MKEKNKSLLYLAGVIIVLALLVYTTLVGWTNAHKGTAKNIILGLDLAGGVSITYEANEANPSDEAMKDTINKMQTRAEAFSTESSVYQEGTNRITVDIPGVEDATEVLKSLGKEGSLEFVAADQMTEDEDGKPSYKKYILDGTGVEDAQAATQTDETTKQNEYVVQLTLTGKGAKKFAKATKEAYPNKDVIHIVYDGEIISSPAVQAEITDGECVISGNFETYDKAEQLASMIRIGALPLELKEIRSTVVGAQLGVDAIDSSLIAGAIGFGLVVLFMIILYRIPGFSSAVALLFYLAAMLVTLNVLDITLTLPGIAGIILNIGMAVDANVIIFTRIREELAKGKSVRSAIKTGFDKALSAIVDGNVTTLIAAAVLYIKGSGTVRGFATTLAIGIILSMFTALAVTRWILVALTHLGVDDAKYFGVEKEKKTIRFVENRGKFFVISGILIVACIVSLVINKQSSLGNVLNYGLDFLGGTSVNVTFDDDTELNSDFKADIEALVKDTADTTNVVISDIAGENTLNIKTVEMNLDQRGALTDALMSDYKVQEKDIEMESISGAVSSEMRKDAVVAVIIATICMLLYIWFRFKDVVFAGSAVLALIHDVLVVLLVYAALRINVGNTFIACMLTIVGYSINATIVIFDRIRENLGSKRSKEALAELVNESITQTLTRSINTSLTTFFMVVVLAILGVDSIREFAIPIMAGIVCGAYSSVCITGTLWYSIKSKFVNQ